MVSINAKDIPKNIAEMRMGGNKLKFEMIRFPLSEVFNSSLSRLKSQLDEFKNSNRLYYHQVA